MTKIKDYARYLSRKSARRGPSPIRALNPLMKIEGMISLGGGVPNPQTYPFDKITISLKDGSQIELSGKRLIEALEYGPSYGNPALVEWLKAHQERVHKVPYESSADWHVMACTGSQDALSIAYETFLNEGDSIITENPTYSGSLALLAAFGGVIAGIDIDDKGMIPELLESVLTNWDHSKPFPKVMYVTPTGQNPAGCTMSADRKQEIYAIASKFDLLILEDDPYYFLSYSTIPPTSFLSMDVDARVIRFDSFSKVLSSGLRLGWVTGPIQLIERMQFHQQVAAMHASGLSQMMALQTLEAWGWQGWEKHLKFVQEFYKQRRDIFLVLAEKYLSGHAVWFAPSAGMFVWFKLLAIQDSKSLIFEKAVKKKVLLLPGQVFSPSNTPSQYVRASFSTATPDQMEEALKRFAQLIAEESST